MTVLIDLIESQMTKYITRRSIQDNRPSITKQLPRSIEKPLSQSSPSKDIFNKTTPYYEQHLARCGYNEKLTYQQQGENIEYNKIIGKIENAILCSLTHPTAKY